ncbi:lysosomal alpha-mannosidase [Biomphalaria pfeifferi]|uniref:Alpha-mannosidase n=1 Tax=Biomphalaria pfeifferi TaxID=112525 RepID=A0AAD8FAR4_BIOPF|nr:lysosomal alpha-mannosidase [Biomphalaria pfeifferi]
MRISFKRLIHVTAALVFIQLVHYLWSTSERAKKMVVPRITLHNYVPPEETSKGTCSYKLCPKVKEGALNIHLIAHSHIDVGWTHTVDDFYTGAAVGTSCTKCILDLTIKELAKNPERRYIFIEMKYFSRFWQEIDEKDKDLIRQLIKERRLELVGGGWVMSDAGVTMYNDIIDQHTLGFDFIADTFGTCAQARTAWHVDLFGYSREHASILSQMGYDSLFIGRIDFMDMEQRKKTKNMEFLWNTSPNNLKDKSALFTNILYEGYYAPPGYTMDKFSVAPEVTQPIVDSFVNLIKKWSVSFKSNHVVVAMGADFAYRNAETWFNFYDPLIKMANEMHPDIHLMYSTPSCYSYYVNKERVTLEEKKEDFHPYSIPPAAYWTGFYTSRGGLKRHIKQAGQILQSCKQLSIFTDLQDSFQDVNVLRDAMGVMQHHDAVTGTQRTHVHSDYNRILSQATSVCEKVMAAAYRKLWKLPVTVTPQFCYGLNMSACHVSESSDQFLVTVYNPLSWTFDVGVRFPVKGQQLVIMDSRGHNVPYQLAPVHEHIGIIPERVSIADKEAVILVNLPPMSMTTFSVQQFQGGQTKQLYENSLENSNLVIENEYLSLTFNYRTGLLQSITNKYSSLTEPVKQEFRYYESEQESNRPSGVYLFTPKSNITFPIAAERVTLKYVKGPLVQEVHQSFSTWVSQVIRLYKGSKHVEFQWTVGPINSDSDYQGKEVISVFTTNIANEDTFYTDSNGREMLQRTKDERDTWDLPPTDRVSGNYYPVTSRIYIKDIQRNVQFSLFTDRPQGGSSLKSGVVELMLHRRVYKDDDLGLAEFLVDNGADGKGIIYTGKHFLVLDTIESSASLNKQLALQVHLAPTVMFTPITKDTQPTSNLQRTFLSGTLPVNVHVLTLDRISSNNTMYLLRLEHIFEEKEHKTLSLPAEVSLQSLFQAFEIVSAVETTLGGNFIPEDLKRLQWNTYSSVTPDNIRSPDYRRNMEPPFTVRLRPMEIRTFNILVTRI